MTAGTHLRPGFVLALMLGFGAVAVYMLTPPLVERVSDALERRQARSTQLAVARATAGQREELARRVGAMEHVVDEQALFQKGLNVGALQATISMAVQGSGGVVRSMDTATEGIGNGRQRLTSRVAIDATPEAIQNALTQLEAGRPRLLIQAMHLHPATTQAPDGPVVLTLELEIDAYADLAAH
ncbi:GspMb/PilO family protein [Nitrospirillum viridazoti]|uniref:Type II secretion system (T2SS) protein M subtype b n=1 Tax=Nitrospirillum amazonense TaxID=28077 RepID=A0A560HRD9_9PROT|nr:GspMb/PilO family protein [Nitrospirillum amazonense]TWB48955.1 type II secretion system (T2SS) protein M subtype b [Nitrospirillum amazonense]